MIDRFARRRELQVLDHQPAPVWAARKLGFLSALVFQLPDSQQIVVPVDSTGFSFSESLTITITWTDHRGKEYRQLETVTIMVNPQSFWDKVIMMLNKIF